MNKRRESTYLNMNFHNLNVKIRLFENKIERKGNWMNKAYKMLIEQKKKKKKQALVKHFIYRVSSCIHRSSVNLRRDLSAAIFHKFVKSIEGERKREGKIWRSREAGRKRKSLALLAGALCWHFAFRRLSLQRMQRRKHRRLVYIRERRIYVCGW